MLKSRAAKSAVFVRALFGCNDEDVSLPRNCRRALRSLSHAQRVTANTSLGSGMTFAMGGGTVLS